MTDLECMRSLDVKTVNRRELVDIREITINTQQPVQRRINEYINKIKNPYCFLYGDYVVKISFPENGVTLEEKLQELFKGGANL